MAALSRRSEAATPAFAPSSAAPCSTPVSCLPKRRALVSNRQPRCCQPSAEQPRTRRRTWRQLQPEKSRHGWAEKQPIGAGGRTHDHPPGAGPKPRGAARAAPVVVSSSLRHPFTNPPMRREPFHTTWPHPARPSTSANCYHHDSPARPSSVLT